MTPSGKVLASGLVAAIILGITLAATQLDAPSVVHAQRLDAARTERLNQTEIRIQNFVRSAKRLPVHIDDLWAENGYSRENLLDPETRQPFEYSTVNDNTYELCATFLTASKESSGSPMQNNWTHPSGHFCFIRHIAVS